MPHFSNSREITIAAAPAVVHAQVDDFRAWTAWSPWEDLDPDLERTYSGAATGAGARYAWVGNSKAGEGHMEFAASTPERIEIDLEPRGEGTRLVWTMSGERNLVLAVLGKLFFDKAIAKDFDRGLARLKAVSEAVSEA